MRGFPANSFGSALRAISICLLLQGTALAATPEICPDKGANLGETFSNLFGKTPAGAKPYVYYGKTASADKIATVFIETELNGKPNLCSGILIGRDRVLTAAHCVARVISRMKVGFGPARNGLMTVSVTAAAIKPGFERIRRGNDLAVLTIDRASVCDVYGPVAVASGGTLLKLAPPTMTVVGFGLTEKGESGNRLEAGIPTASLTCFPDWTIALSCRRFEEFVLAVSSTTIKGADTCQGDSGGPAFLYRPSNASSAPLLAGVTSRGVSTGSGTPCGAGGIYEAIGTTETLNWLRLQVPDLMVE